MSFSLLRSQLCHAWFQSSFRPFPFEFAAFAAQARNRSSSFSCQPGGQPDRRLSIVCGNGPGCQSTGNRCQLLAPVPDIFVGVGDKGGLLVRGLGEGKRGEQGGGVSSRMSHSVTVTSCDTALRWRCRRWRSASFARFSAFTAWLAIISALTAATIMSAVAPAASSASNIAGDRLILPPARA